MDNSDVLQRNADGKLEVRVVNGTEKADAPANYDDVFTVNTEGKRALRVVGAGGGGGTTPTAAGVSFDPAGLTTITGDNVQSALEEVDAALSDKVATAQGAENAGKVMTVGADGNVVPTAGYATQSWVETQITNSIGTIETALAEV